MAAAGSFEAAEIAQVESLLVTYGFQIFERVDSSLTWDDVGVGLEFLA